MLSALLATQPQQLANMVSSQLLGLLDGLVKVWGCVDSSRAWRRVTRGAVNCPVSLHQPGLTESQLLPAFSPHVHILLLLLLRLIPPPSSPSQDAEAEGQVTFLLLLLRLFAHLPIPLPMLLASPLQKAVLKLTKSK